MVYRCLQTWCKHDFKQGLDMTSNMRGIIKKSQVDQSVREGVREFVGYWGAYAPRNQHNLLYRALHYIILTIFWAFLDFDIVIWERRPSYMPVETPLCLLMMVELCFPIIIILWWSSLFIVSWQMNLRLLL